MLNSEVHCTLYEYGPTTNGERMNEFQMVFCTWNWLTFSEWVGEGRNA